MPAGSCDCSKGMPVAVIVVKWSSSEHRHITLQLGHACENQIYSVVCCYSFCSVERKQLPYCLTVQPTEDVPPSLQRSSSCSDSSLSLEGILSSILCIVSMWVLRQTHKLCGFGSWCRRWLELLCLRTFSMEAAGRLELKGTTARLPKNCAF